MACAQIGLSASVAPRVIAAYDTRLPKRAGALDERTGREGGEGMGTGESGTEGGRVGRIGAVGGIGEDTG